MLVQIPARSPPVLLADECVFVQPAELNACLPARLARRVHTAISARQRGTATYAEHGTEVRWQATCDQTERPRNTPADGRLRRIDQITRNLPAGD